MGINWSWLINTAADDDGSRTSGTVINKAALQELLTELDSNLFDADFPDVYPAVTTKAVWEATAPYDNLKQRLDSIQAPETGLPNPTFLEHYVDVSSAADSLGNRNLCPNDDIQLWSQGATSAPDFVTVYGGNIARAGLLESDTTHYIGRFSGKITFVANPSGVYWNIMTAGVMTLVQQIRGAWKVGYGIWLAASAANTTRAWISDGVQTVYSDYVPADGNFHFMTILGGPMTINAAATYLRVGAESAAAGDFYFFGPTPVYGSVAPSRWFPCDTETFPVLEHFISGNVSTGDDKKVVSPVWPCLIQDTQLTVITAPATTDIIADLDMIDAAGARTAVYATRPRIAAAAKAGSAVPDPAAYSSRCLRGVHGATFPTSGGTLHLNIDQIGTGTVGANLTATVTALRYKRPSLLDRFGTPGAGY